MRRYLAVVGALLGLLLAAFLFVEALEIPLLADPRPWLDERNALVALLGINLLVVDVLLPVPSSIVMVANGAVFGVVLGALLSLLGSAGAALFGFALGRRGGPLLDRLVPASERAPADRFLSRWGPLAIVVSRPVPIAAETIALMAGASTLSWRRAALAAVIGSLPGAVLYAVVGAAAAGVDTGALVFGAVVLLAAFTWLVARRLEPRCWSS
jgi:uncharacterized membrane protein YdjX (TVP38/TMEM64 family)